MFFQQTLNVFVMHICLVFCSCILWGICGKEKILNHWKYFKNISDVFFPLRLFGPFSLEHLAASLELLYSLEVYYCRSENLQISLSSNKDNIRNVSHYNSIYFLSYVYPRYIKRLFTNMQKQQNKLKNSLLLI